MKRYTLALDLIDSPELIAQYEHLHKAENGWPEISESITGAGILQMEIYRTGNRLFMIIQAEDDFDFDKKAKMDSANAKVQEWEQLMWKFQLPLPWAEEGQKWILMDRIFTLSK